MVISVKKWGNSLGIRIPKSLASEVNIEEGSSLDIKVLKNKIEISRIQDNELTLEILIDKINSDNIHAEIESNGAVGAELW